MLLLQPGGGLEDLTVASFPLQLGPGDCLVVNDTRVRAARLRGRVGGRSAEALLLRQEGPGRFAALVRPGRRLGPGAVMNGPGWELTVLGPASGHPGAREVKLRLEAGVELEEVGEIPLPPYLKRQPRDPERYQTVYARGPGVSAAAPTAGLHLTEELLAQCQARGAELARVQLEVGIGTFAPIRSASIAEHRMHAERFQIPAPAAQAIARARTRGGRVVAVGTTSVRCLESRPDGRGGVLPGAGETELYLRPGSRFQVVDGLLTNFHQPRSSLLVMISAFFGTAPIRSAYAAALSRGYRFLSFGDCMFGWRAP